MNSLFEGRGSESPYVEAVWRGWAGSDYAPVCPASDRWHLLLSKTEWKGQHLIRGCPSDGPLRQPLSPGMEKHEFITRHCTVSSAAQCSLPAGRISLPVLRGIVAQNLQGRRLCAGEPRMMLPAR